MNPILLAILTGGVAAAGVKLIDNLIQWWLERRSRKKDATEEAQRKEEEAKKAALDAQKCAGTELLHATADGVKWMLYDRIKYLGTRYIDDASVDFNDRRLLHEMHKVYHYGLHGNGDLDLIMDAVDALPTKT